MQEPVSGHASVVAIEAVAFARPEFLGDRLHVGVVAADPEAGAGEVGGVDLDDASGERVPAVELEAEVLRLAERELRKVPAGVGDASVLVVVGVEVLGFDDSCRRR